MAGPGSNVQLTDDEVTYLLNVLRTAPAPMTMTELVEALRKRSAR